MCNAVSLVKTLCNSCQMTRAAHQEGSMWVTLARKMVNEHQAFVVECGQAGSRRPTSGTWASRGPMRGQMLFSYDVAGLTSTSRSTRSGLACATAKANTAPKDSPRRYMGRSGSSTFTCCSRYSLQCHMCWSVYHEVLRQCCHEVLRTEITNTLQLTKGTQAVLPRLHRLLIQAFAFQAVNVRAAI